MPVPIRPGQSQPPGRVCPREPNAILQAPWRTYADVKCDFRTPGVLQFLQQHGVLLPFGRGKMSSGNQSGHLHAMPGSLLTVLAAWASALEQLGSLSIRCQRLRPQQRHYLCGSLSLRHCSLQPATQRLSARLRIMHRPVRSDRSVGCEDDS